MNKPNGMCTIACDAKKKTVTVGFHTSEQAQQHRDDLIELAIESTMGRNSMGINFTPEEQNTATAQTILDAIENMRKEAQQHEQRGEHEAAKRMYDFIDIIEKSVNEALDQHRPK